MSITPLEFSAQYLAILARFHETTCEVPQEHAASVVPHLRKVCDEILALQEGQEHELLTAVAASTTIETLNAVHFGYAPEGLESLLRSAVVYFDRVIFQEYISRAIAEDDLTAERCHGLRANIQSLLAVAELLDLGVILVLPNRGFKDFAREPPKIQSVALRPFARYLLPTLQLSGAVDAIPFTTWSRLRQPIFKDFRKELGTEFAVHPQVTRGMWESALVTDVFRQVLASETLPRLTTAGAKETLAMRSRFSGFRGELARYSKQRYSELSSADLQDGAARVAQSLGSALGIERERRHSQRKKTNIHYAIGNLLTLLGLSPVPFFNILCAGGSFANSTLNLWSDLRHGQTPSNVLFEGLFALEEQVAIGPQ